MKVPTYILVSYENELYVLLKTIYKSQNEFALKADIESPMKSDWEPIMGHSSLERADTSKISLKSYGWKAGRMSNKLLCNFVSLHIRLFLDLFLSLIFISDDITMPPPPQCCCYL